MSKNFFWRTIKIGTYKNLDALRKALKDSNMDITVHGNVIFRQTTLSDIEREIDIAIVSQMDLGFPTGKKATNEMIFKAARKLGLGLCPAEVGPQLRLQYPDQQETEYIVVGMEPILEFDPMLFTVFHSHENNLALGSDFGNPAYWFNEKTLFAFVCGK
jgi:hypothetical protein